MLLRQFLLFGLLQIAWTTKPPGYIEKPKIHDPNPPKYDFGYTVDDGAGNNQEHYEHRDGEHTQGHYYVNLPKESSNQEVEYVADDWGFHPLVKYSSSTDHGSSSTQLALGEEAVKRLHGQVTNTPLKKNDAQYVSVSTGSTVPYVTNRDNIKNIEVSPTPSLLPTKPNNIIINHIPTSTFKPTLPNINDFGLKISPNKKFNSYPQISSTTPLPPIHNKQEQYSKLVASTKDLVSNEDLLKINGAAEFYNYENEQIHQNQPVKNYYKVGSTFKRPVGAGIISIEHNTHNFATPIVVADINPTTETVYTTTQSPHEEKSKVSQKFLAPLTAGVQLVNANKVSFLDDSNNIQTSTVKYYEEDNYDEGKTQVELFKSVPYETTFKNSTQSEDGHVNDNSNVVAHPLQQILLLDSQQQYVQPPQLEQSGGNYFIVQHPVLENHANAQQEESHQQNQYVQQSNQESVSHNEENVYTNVVNHYSSQPQQQYINVNPYDQSGQIVYYQTEGQHNGHVYQSEQQHNEHIEHHQHSSNYQISKPTTVQHTIQHPTQVSYQSSTPIPSHSEIHIQQPIQVEKIVEKPVEVIKYVDKPYPVQVTQQVPVPIHIHHPYPVDRVVEKNVPYPVTVEKIIEKEVPVEVKVPYPVEKIVEKIIEKPIHITQYVDKPYPVEKRIPYPVQVEKIVEKKVPVPIEVQVPIQVEVPQLVPYPVEKIIEQPVHIPYPVEKPVPYKVEEPYFIETNNLKAQDINIYSANQWLQYGWPVEINYNTGYQQNHQQQQQIKYPKYVDSYYRKPASSYSDNKAEGNQWIPTTGGQGSKNLDYYIGPAPLKNAYSSWNINQAPINDNNLKYRRSDREAKGIRLEYGFKPPLIPSIEIDLLGRPINRS